MDCGLIPQKCNFQADKNVRLFCFFENQQINNLLFIITILYFVYIYYNTDYQDYKYHINIFVKILPTNQKKI